MDNGLGVATFFVSEESSIGGFVAETPAVEGVGGEGFCE